MIFAHLQERKTVFYSVWYNAPKLLPAGGLERGGTDCVFGVKDVALLSQATSFTPSFHIIYINDARPNKHKIRS